MSAEGQSTFEKCLAFVLQREGLNSDDPHDRGGRTRKGITQSTYDQWRRKHGLPTQDVFAMPDSECEDIYREEYYDPAHCDALEPPLALYVFDTSVNQGIHKAIVILQQSIDVPDDGVFGPQTLERVSTCNLHDTVEFYHARREIAYRATANFDRYGHGWLSRNDACRDLALSWI